MRQLKIFMWCNILFLTNLLFKQILSAAYAFHRSLYAVQLFVSLMLCILRHTAKEFNTTEMQIFVNKRPSKFTCYLTNYLWKDYFLYYLKKSIIGIGIAEELADSSKQNCSLSQNVTCSTTQNVTCSSRRL